MAPARTLSVAARPRELHCYQVSNRWTRIDRCRSANGVELSLQETPHRWQKAFAEKDEPINWPAWLDSNRQPTRHKDYAYLLGKHIPIATKTAPIHATAQTARAG